MAAAVTTAAVCTRNRPDDLARCLDSLEPAREACEGPVEVPGLDVARNRALAEARGTWLAFVDDDVRVDPQWLQGLALARQEHPDAAAVVGLVLPAELTTQAQIRFENGGGFGRGFAQRRWDGRHGPGGRLHPLGAGAFGAGCDMAFDVAVLRRLGGFDEALDTGPPCPEEVTWTSSSACSRPGTAWSTSRGWPSSTGTAGA